MPVTLTAASDAIPLLYLNPSPEWEEEGAITGSYILGLLVESAGVLANGGAYDSVFSKVIASSCCK